VGDSHELVQGWPTNDGIEGEVDLCDVEEDDLCAVVPGVPNVTERKMLLHGMMEPGPTPEKGHERGEPGHRNL
jgi:hypothetical protein